MKKHHLHAFHHEKLFEKQLLPHCQTYSNYMEKSMHCTIEKVGEKGIAIRFQQHQCWVKEVFKLILEEND